MRNGWIAAAALLVLAGCGGGEEPAPARKKAPASDAAAPAPAASKAPAVKSDPDGKNLCISCQIRTNEPACPGCKTVLKAAMDDKPKSPSGAVGQSMVGVSYACPTAGCKYQSARKEDCMTHAGTMLKEVWFSCAKCGESKPAPGKCSKCSGDLARTLK